MRKRSGSGGGGAGGGGAGVGWQLELEKSIELPLRPTVQTAPVSREDWGGFFFLTVNKHWVGNVREESNLPYQARILSDCGGYVCG